MSTENDPAAVERNKLAILMAPIVADRLRPSIRLDVWSSSLVAALIAGSIAYGLSRVDMDSLRDEMRGGKVKAPSQVTNTINMEQPRAQESSLQREILQQQGHIPKDGDK